MFDLLSWDRDKTVNSGYGPRKSPGGVGSTNHKGIDLSSDNDDIPNVHDGTVVASGWNASRGYYISVLGTDGYTSTYQHMASKSPLAVGTKVTEGQTLGTQGNTGASTGKHLHYEVKSGSGLYVNPLDYLAGKFSTGDPVTDGATGGHDQPIHSGATNSLADVAMNVAGKVIKVVVAALIVVLAAILFLKAFDIKLRK